MLVISNRPCASRSADLKLFARLLPELYSTRSNYYYKLNRAKILFPIRICVLFFPIAIISICKMSFSSFVNYEKDFYDDIVSQIKIITD